MKGNKRSGASSVVNFMLFVAMATGGITLLVWSIGVIKDGYRRSPLGVGGGIESQTATSVETEEREIGWRTIVSMNGFDPKSGVSWMVVSFSENTNNPAMHRACFMNPSDGVAGSSSFWRYNATNHLAEAYVIGRIFPPDGHTEFFIMNDARILRAEH